MYLFSRRARAHVAAVTTVVVAALSVAVPLLDQGRTPGAVAFAGSAEAGYIDHHHDVCVQHSAGAWSATVGAELPSEQFVHEADTTRRGDDHGARPGPTLPQPRAPPLV